MIGQSAEGQDRAEDRGCDHAHGRDLQGVDQCGSEGLGDARPRVEEDRPARRIQLTVRAEPPQGQAEASRAIGLTFGQSLREVVLPQAFRTVVPPLGNVWIALAKNTSIAAGFAVTELAAALVRLSNQNSDQLLTVFLAIVAAYLLITLPSAWLIGVIERRTAIVR